MDAKKTFENRAAFQPGQAAAEKAEEQTARKVVVKGAKPANAEAAEA